VALADRTFLDTSVLLAGLVEMGDASSAAASILDAVADGTLRRPFTAWHCCLEFYSVATRLPGGLRLEPQQARRLLEEEVLRRFEVCDLPGKARSRFLADAAGERVSGGRVYDAHIAESARLAGARIVVTDNRRHFVTLMRHGITVWKPEAFVENRGLH
jgi:predicted nucleic acid-binding protein